jgi:3-oxoadipate enol-lactonase
MIEAGEIPGAGRVRLEVDWYPSCREEADISVVLCHGFGGSRRNFRLQARAIRSLCHTLLYDARGHGKSEAPRREEAYRFDCLVTDLFHLVESLPTPQVVLGGLSLGAATALSFARRHPSRVRGLLLASLPGAGSELRDWAWSFADAIERHGVKGAVDRYLLSRFGGTMGEEAGLVRQGFLEHQPHALVGLLRHCVAQFPLVSSISEDGLPLSIPTQIVAGQRDLVSVEQSRRLHQMMPASQLTLVPGAGHVVNLMAPEEFNAVLRAFLDRLSPPRSWFQ